MSTLINVVHIVTCILLILVVLIQSGKGAEISASLGGSSQTIFGSSGGANFFTRFTSIMAAVFMATSLYLTWKGGQDRKGLFGSGAVTQQNQSPTAPSNPAAPAPAAQAPVAPAQAPATPEKK